MLKENKAVLADVAEKMAYNFEKTYHGCSQAVIRAVLHSLGIQEEGLFAASFPLAGGLGLKQGTCGAVVGAIMCLGLVSKKYGRSWDEFNKWSLEEVVDSLNATGAFYERCKEELSGTVECREISGMEINTQEDIVKYSASPNFENCCKNCGKLARLTVTTLLMD